MKKFLCVVLALTLCGPVYAGKDYAKRFPTDTAMEVCVPNSTNPDCGGEPGVTDHSALSNLDYDHAGHTGFQPAGSYLESETDPLSLHLDQTTPQTLSNVGIVTAVDADYVFIGDTSDSGKLKKALKTDFAGGGGSQTPWTSDIDGADYDLTGVTDIEAKDVTAEEVISSEMVANNSFDTDTLFTTEHGTINYSSGSYTFLASAVKSQAFSDMLIAPSSGVRRYKYEFVVSAASGSSVIFCPIYPHVSVTITATGTYSGEVDCEITDPFKFGSGSSGNASVTVDSISIKEITKGNVYADQRMYAQRFVTEGGTATQVVLGNGALGSALLLDQTTPQTVTGGVPNFSQGIQVSTTGGVTFSDGGASVNMQFDGTNFRFSTSLERNDATNYDIGTVGNPWNNIYGNYFWGDGSGLTGVDPDFSASTTDDLTEGSTNLYFSGKTTDDLSEGSSNLYFSGKTTDDLSEGSTNKYHPSGGYTGDLNDSTSTKIADVVDGLITAVYY